MEVADQVLPRNPRLIRAGFAYLTHGLFVSGDKCMKAFCWDHGAPAYATRFETTGCDMSVDCRAAKAGGRAGFLD